MTIIKKLSIGIDELNSYQNIFNSVTNNYKILLEEIQTKHELEMIKLENELECKNEFIGKFANIIQSRMPFKKYLKVLKEGVRDCEFSISLAQDILTDSPFKEGYVNNLKKDKNEFERLIDKKTKEISRLRCY